MSAEDFVNIDSSVITTELPTDEDIVEDILISEVMSIKEGRKVLENAKKFLEQQEFATEKDIKKLEDDELPDYDELAFLFNDENALGEESRLPLANDSKVNFIGIREHTVY
ncbi:14257_t:CDS:2 [Entrophospora sp. SA101]|nr:14257_t:CDS:2 [Entrophospora sp. SA101]